MDPPKQEMKSPMDLIIHGVAKDEIILHLNLSNMAQLVYIVYSIDIVVNLNPQSMRANSILSQWDWC